MTDEDISILNGHPVVVSKDRKSVTIGDGRSFPITNLIDVFGDDTDNFEMADVVVRWKRRFVVQPAG